MRDRISDLAKSCQAVEDAALAYWVNSTAKTAGSTAATLTGSINRLSRLAVNVRSAGLEFDQPRLIAAIRQAATGGDFGKKGRRHRASDAQLLSEVAGTLEDLLLDVDTAFYAAFRPIRSRKLARWLPVSATLLLISEKS